MSSCPQIKKFLAFFLFTDLFNSSTNCLLYSLSGKLFRKKFISIIKIIFTCGRNILWNVKPHSLVLPSQQIELQPSNELSTVLNCSIHSRYGSYRRSEPFSSIEIKHLQNKKMSDDNVSLSMGKISDEHETEVESIQKIRLTDKFKNRQTIKTFLMNKVQLFGATKNTKSRKTDHKRGEIKTNISYTAASSGARSIRNAFQRQPWNNQRHSSKVVLVNTDDNPSLTKEISLETTTNL